VAVNLYVTANLAKISLERISRAVFPFIVAMMVALAIIIYWTGLSTRLPRLFRLG